MYDDPVEQAKRLITFHKDMPWAQRELAELVPLLLEKIPDEDVIEDKDTEIRYLGERIENLEDEISDLESDIDSLEKDLNEKMVEYDKLFDEAVEWRDKYLALKELSND